MPLIYLAGVLVFGLNFLVQLAQLAIRMLRHPGHDLGGYRLVEMSEDAAPYSFWNRIFLNSERYDSDTFHQIFQHEQIHVTQRHSIDLLLAELIVIAQWCNPFAWLYRRAVEDNLEFLTDAEMLRAGSDPERYQLSLVRVAVPNFPNALVASYNQNFLEKRIAMMKTKRSSLRSGWKYLTLLPLLLFSVLQFNAIAQVPQPPAPPAPPSSIPPVSAPAPATAPQPTPTTVSRAYQVERPTSAPAPTPRATPARPSPPEPAQTPQIDGQTDFNSWTAIIERPDICFQFMSRNRPNESRFNYQSSRCFALSEFSDLPRGTMGSFELERAAGTITLRGVFEDDDGVGNFSFNPNATFVSQLKDAGYGTYDDRELMLFFLSNINKDYLDYLAAEDLNPSHQQLLELAIFYDDTAELKERRSTLRRNDFGDPSLQQLIELQIHGVNAAYIDDLAAAGFPNLQLSNIIEAKIHGVSSRFATEMNDLGFRDLSFDEIKAMAIHGISTKYVRELNGLGYTDISAQEVVESKIHGVNASRIADWKQAGYDDLTLQEAKQWAIHGVDADLVRGLAEVGLKNLSIQDVVSAKIHGISPEYVRQWNRDDLGLQDYISRKIHGIRPEVQRPANDQIFRNGLGVAKATADVLYWSADDHYLTLGGKIVLRDNQSNATVRGTLTYGNQSVDGIIYNGRPLKLGEKIDVSDLAMSIEIVKDGALAREQGLSADATLAVVTAR